LFYLDCDATSGVYQFTQPLLPEVEAFQYRIKNTNEPQPSRTVQIEFEADLNGQKVVEKSGEGPPRLR
jgi:hypothetical protein